MNEESMNKFTLSFDKNPSLEAEFFEDYKAESRHQVMMGTISGFPTIALFFLVDYLIFPEIYEKLFQFRLILTVISLALILYTFVINKKANFLFYISFLGPLLSAIMQVHIMAVGQYNIHLIHFPGMMLILMYNYMFLRQRFYHAVISSLILLTYFVALFSGTELFYNSDFYMMLTFLIASMLIGLVASYVLEQSLRKSYLLKRSLQKAVRDRKEIYQVVVHDLKNPVSIINSQIHLLKASGKIEEKYSQRIFNSTGRMIYLLDHLLKFCEIEEDNTQIELKEYNIHEIMDICIESNAINAEAKNISIIHIKHNSHSFVGEMDGFKTQEVFDNLISNAIKYSPFDSTVEIYHLQDEEYFKVFVKDFGQGIKQDEIDKVFVKFSKLSSIPTAGEHSNGLGLSLSKELMELQGGTITCESQLGGWTLFTVYIPKKSQNKVAA